METLFFECESAFEGSMSYINICLESAIAEYRDELLTNHYVVEATRETMWTRIKQFFTKIIIAIENFTKELKVKIEYAVNEKHIKQKLRTLRDELKEKQSDGVRTVEMIDYASMIRIFKRHYDKMVTYAKKFSKVKYTKTYQIEDDLKDFNNLMDKLNDELEAASAKKIQMSVKKALDFVENEITGRSETFTTLNTLMSDIAEIEQIANGLKTKLDILGADVLPKHLNFIQRMVNAIASFVRKWTVRIIMGVVFIFTI